MKGCGAACFKHHQDIIPLMAPLTIQTTREPYESVPSHYRFDLCSKPSIIRASDPFADGGRFLHVVTGYRVQWQKKLVYLESTAGYAGHGLGHLIRFSFDKYTYVKPSTGVNPTLQFERSHPQERQAKYQEVKHSGHHRKRIPSE